MNGNFIDPVIEKEEEKEEKEENKDIVFDCYDCGIAVIRDSREHDECVCVEYTNGERWYCGNCGLPYEEEEDN